MQFQHVIPAENDQMQWHRAHHDSSLQENVAPCPKKTLICKESNDLQSTLLFQVRHLNLNKEPRRCLIHSIEAFRISYRTSNFIIHFFERLVWR